MDLMSMFTAAGSPWRARPSAVALIPTLVLACAGSATNHPEESSMSNPIPEAAREIAEAAALSYTALSNDDIEADDYTLIRAARIIPPDTGCQGARCWLVTYKLTRLIPGSPDAEVGKGGELFIQVDLDAGRAWVSGYGE